MTVRFSTPELRCLRFSLINSGWYVTVGWCWCLGRSHRVCVCRLFKRDVFLSLYLSLPLSLSTSISLADRGQQVTFASRTGSVPESSLCLVSPFRKVPKQFVGRHVFMKFYNLFAMSYLVYVFYFIFTRGLGLERRPACSRTAAPTSSLKHCIIVLHIRGMGREISSSTVAVRVARSFFFFSFLVLALDKPSYLSDVIGAFPSAVKPSLLMKRGIHDVLPCFVSSTPICPPFPVPCFPLPLGCVSAVLYQTLLTHSCVLPV